MSQTVNQQPTTKPANQDRNDLDRDGWSNGKGTQRTTGEPRSIGPEKSLSRGLDFYPGGWLE